MITAACPQCGKVSQFNDSAAARQAKCPGCRGELKLPQVTATSRAIEEAMRAMDAKEAKRKGKPREQVPHRSKAHEAYNLGSGKATHAAPPPAINEKRKITPKQWKVIAGAAGAVAAIAMVCNGVLPTEWESLHRDEVIQMKTEADQLASDGKPAAAFSKYRRVLLMSTGHSAKSRELRQAVHEAEAACARLMEQNRDLIERALAAAARQ